MDVVFDPLGGALMDTAFRTLGWGGRHLVIGFASGQIGSLRGNLAIVKGASLVGVDIRQFREKQPAAARRLLQDVADDSFSSCASGPRRRCRCGSTPAISPVR